MRLLISILLNFVILFNSAGYLVLYYQLKSHFKSDAKKQIESFIPLDKLTHITIPADVFENGNDDFYFVEPHEFIYFGKMYDICEYSYSGDKVSIFALRDDKENMLEELFAQFFSRTLNDEHSGVSSLINMIIKDAGLPSEFIVQTVCNTFLCCDIVNYTLLKNFFDVPTPPPKYSV